MRLNKFLSSIIFVTLFSVLYVYQQSEIVRLAYAEEKQHIAFQELLDRNSVLRYNIEKNCSLINIGNTLFGRSDFQMPDKYQLVRLVPTNAGATFVKAAGNKETLLSRIFGLNKQAEAKTINP
ncbi:MAG: hypothetical protein COT38_00805 [Candidatus Omnitrophica bacterium CG08_land_8_20_14_0_20_41_16]|uniref:Uncharacterized protein n=1 Tax=Candidatus Sherwoodlollariibacterium unditelluris TaxID=1974757 RepID=A0A2G9YHP9_9BACT|nr:MAG: hypothetical protein COX41_06475 [Candidatus Omnitrophica bacterium CG23_combo_of_CG06-09_8_20_14_all_41_10]PIS34317.1 MAG: hypothetical protein COT38_00805 [Candidatus Omnitrophica bacterium CG08_land_8_20_14_0_20_41_16]